MRFPIHSNIRVICVDMRGWWWYRLDSAVWAYLEVCMSWNSHRDSHRVHRLFKFDVNIKKYQIIRDCVPKKRSCGGPHFYRGLLLQSTTIVVLQLCMLIPLQCYCPWVFLYMDVSESMVPLNPLVYHFPSFSLKKTGAFGYPLVLYSSWRLYTTMGLTHASRETMDTHGGDPVIISLSYSDSIQANFC